MPKKSKRDKIRADIRRRTRNEVTISIEKTPSPITTTAHTFTFHAPAQTKTTMSQPGDVAELVAIKHDLTKTAILATVAIAAELVLYFSGLGK